MEQPKRIQGKRWCFTINNPEPEDFEAISFGIYGMCQQERGSTCGTLHIQGFCIFSTNQTLKALKKLNHRAHWELMKGDLEANEEYCSKLVNKDGSVAREPGTEPRTWGERPVLKGRRHSHRFSISGGHDQGGWPGLDLLGFDNPQGSGGASDSIYQVFARY